MIQDYKAVLVLVTTVFLFLAPPAVQGGENGNIFETVATGKHMIDKDQGGVPAAKKAAVEKALSASVEKALLNLFSGKIFASNLEFIYSKVLTDVSDYVASYKVLAEVEKRDRCIVAVDTGIDLAALRSFLNRYEIIGSQKNKPSVLLLISEKTKEDLLPRYWWGKNPMPYNSKVSEAVSEAMKEKGFIVLPASFSSPDTKDHDIEFSSIHDTDAAIKLGRKMDADIVVMGRAESQPSANRVGAEQTYEAKVDVEALSTAENKTVASTRVKATSRSKEGTEGSIAALSRAGELTGQKITGKIEDHWNDNVLKKQQAIEAKIEGNDYLSSFILLRKVLKKMPEIKGIQTRELGTQEAVVDILFEGNAARLADALVLKTFDSFGIEIDDVKDRSLTIRFVPKDENQPAVDEDEVKGAYITE
ncbi:MAG: hypothetical protein R6V41_11305 [Desulfobacteraceae bacterium]